MFEQGHPLAGTQVPAQRDHHIIRRVEHLVQTAIEAKPTSSDPFKLAQAWVQKHGVTLPPDTPETRSLRNWFCFKVQRFKKGTETEANKRLLAEHGIDLSQYRALNTGRGERPDDAPLVAKLQKWHRKHRTYDLGPNADADLRQWQDRLLIAYTARGRSARMVEIEAQCPGLNYSTWCRPGEQANTGDEHWWENVRLWRELCETTPAYRGQLDPNTPSKLLMWATQQQHRVESLTDRQRGELQDLGILWSDTDRNRHRLREATLRMAREPFAETQVRERDLHTVLGACLFVRLIVRDMPLLDIYATLAITPPTHRRLMSAIIPLLKDIKTHCTIARIRAIRLLLQDHGGFERLALLHHQQTHPTPEILEYLYESAGKVQAEGLWDATRTIMAVHTAFKTLRIAQDIPNADDYDLAFGLLRNRQDH